MLTDAQLARLLNDMKNLEDPAMDDNVETPDFNAWVAQTQGPTPDPVVIDVLERMLALAKTGEVQQIAIIGDSGVDEIHYGVAYDSPAALVMGMEELKLKLLGYTS